MPATSIIFDVGHVLYDWDPRVDAFLRDVCTREWHFQHDAGRPFAETSAELIARYPEHAKLIAAWGPRFSEQIPGPIAGMPELVVELDEADVPLFAITNFSGEFFAPFRAQEAQLFDRFRGIVVSGDERLMKPDPAIYRLALERFGLEPGETVFVDDRADNVAGAEAVGMAGIVFTDASALRGALETQGLLTRRM